VSEQDAALASSESTSLGIIGPPSPETQVGEAGAKAGTPPPQALKTEANADAPVHVDGAEIKPERQGLFGNPRLSAMAAVVALAAVTGALGGALATAALSHLAGSDVSRAGNGKLQASVARIEAEILALTSSIEHTSKLGLAEVTKSSERVDKLEKAQTESAIKIVKPNESVDKLGATPPAPAVAVAAPPPAAQDVTGSISPAAVAPAAAPKIEVARLPTVEGWLLRDVGHGGALIQGRRGYYEVYAGDAVPGLGRVDAIRRQDGRWVVVTTKGLVVAR